MQSLENSNTRVKEDCMILYKAMEDKLKDPATSATTAIWHPKALAIKKMSEDVINYIERLKTRLKKEVSPKNNNDADAFDESNKEVVATIFDKQNEAAMLIEKLNTFRNTAIKQIIPFETADSVLIADVQSGIRHLQLPLDSNEINTTIKDYFKTDALNALMLLSKYQNDVLLTEHTLVDNMFSRISGPHHHWTKFSALAFLSTSYVKQGQTLEVTAGMGAMTNENKPTFIIDGKTIAIGPDGVAKYNFEANRKPGKYFIPVQIEFTQSDGSKQRIIKNLAYIIAE
jgi:hypothetical protein